MKFNSWRRLSRVILYLGAAVIGATFLYIFFYAAAAVDCGRLARLDLVPSMLEHALVATILHFCGVWAFMRLVGRDGK